MRLSFFLREATRSLRRNAVPSFAAMATVLVTMLMLGLFIPIVQASSGAADGVRKKLLVDVYLKSSAGSADAARVLARLKGLPHVGHVAYLTKTQVYVQFCGDHPSYCAPGTLGANPLPATFRVTPDEPGNTLLVASEMTTKDASGTKTPIDASIGQVKQGGDNASKILTFTSTVKWSGLVLALVLVLASVMLIANTIRLSLFARRREVEVMKLVGATDWFIRWPFVLEGILVGALGSLGSLALLGLGKLFVIDRFQGVLTALSSLRTIPFPALVAVIVAVGVLVSALGAGLSLRRFLRV